MIFDANKLYSLEEINEAFGVCVHCSQFIYCRSHIAGEIFYYYCENCNFEVGFEPSIVKKLYKADIIYFIGNHRININHNGAYFSANQKFICSKSIIDLIEFKKNIVDKYRLLI